MDLKKLESKQLNHPSNLVLKNFIANQLRHFNTLLSLEIEEKIKLAKQNFFEHTNKIGKWLAYKLHKNQAEKEKFPTQS